MITEKDFHGAILSMSKYKEGEIKEALEEFMLILTANQDNRTLFNEYNMNVEGLILDGQNGNRIARIPFKREDEEKIKLAILSIGIRCISRNYNF